MCVVFWVSPGDVGTAPRPSTRFSQVAVVDGGGTGDGTSGSGDGSTGVPGGTGCHKANAMLMEWCPFALHPED